MWKIPVSLIAGANEGTTVFTVDTLIGNLWLYLGSLSGPQAITLLVDGADVGDVQITADWDSGSTFQITCINGGRVVGLGGNGGKGGDDNGATGLPGTKGSTGGAALSSNGFVVNIDIDDGYLLGGGGGGGGAPYDDTGAGGDAGGGGGGGAGFSVTDGGDAGASLGLPEAEDGADGGPNGAGMGGVSGGAGTRVSGDGGEFGLGGNVGDSESKAYIGGTGGDAGQAFAPTNGGTIVYTGVKLVATLISEARQIGQTSEGFASMVQIRYNNGGFGGGTQQVGWTFSSIGLLTFNSSATNDTNYQDSWYGGPQSASAVGADYEVRVLAGHTYDNAFTTVPVAEGTWIALGSDRTWELSGAAVTNQSLFQIRSTGSSDILASGHLNCVVV